MDIPDNTEQDYEAAAISALEREDIPATDENIALVIETAKNVSEQGLVGAAEKLDGESEGFLRAVGTTAIELGGVIDRDLRHDLLVMRRGAQGAGQNALHAQRLRIRATVALRRAMPRD